MSSQRIAAVAAEQQELINNPPTNKVDRAEHYDVSLGTSPDQIAFSGTVSRLVVKFDTAGAGLDSIPYKITIPYKRVGNPQGTLSVGIRKASDDSFVPIAEWPIAQDAKLVFVTEPAAPVVPAWINIRVQGNQTYQMAANDKISLEYTPDDTNTIAIGVSTTESSPSGFTCQAYDDGSYGDTANPLAIRIVSTVLTAI